MPKLKIIRILLWLGLLIIAIIAFNVQAASPGIHVLRVKGTINPVLVDYIERGIEQAEDANATACIIQLDTPGGLDTAMRDIVKEIVNARVPVVVYVWVGCCMSATIPSPKAQDHAVGAPELVSVN